MLLMDSANLDQQETKEVLWKETVWWDLHEHLIWDTTKQGKRLEWESLRIEVTIVI